MSINKSDIKELY